MIAHLSYVMCDICGDPAEVAEEATEARRLAKRSGYVRTDDGQDLCKDCKPDTSRGGSK